MFGDILQPTHLLLILVVALLVLGPKRLPEVGKTLGTGLRDFRQAISGEGGAGHNWAQQLVGEAEPETEQRHQPPSEPVVPGVQPMAPGAPVAVQPVAPAPTSADVSSVPDFVPMDAPATAVADAPPVQPAQTLAAPTRSVSAPPRPLAPAATPRTAAAPRRIAAVPRDGQPVRPAARQTVMPQRRVAVPAPPAPAGGDDQGS